MTKQAQKYDCLTGRIRAIVFCGVWFTPPVSAADARKPLIHRGIGRNLQENLLKYRNKGDRESDGLLLPYSSLMVLGKSKNPLQYSSYFAHVRSMPSAGERQALFEFEVWSLKLVVTCPSFRAQRSGVEKSFYAEPHAETAETREMARHFERSGAESRTPL